MSDDKRECPVEGCTAEIKEIRVFGVQVNVDMRGRHYIFETVQNREMEVDCTEGHTTDLDEASEELRDWARKYVKNHVMGWSGG